MNRRGGARFRGRKELLWCRRGRRDSNEQGQTTEAVGHVRGGSGVYVADEMKTVDAWHMLSATERLVLLEMHRAFMRASRFDTEDISGEGFDFPQSYCRELVDDKTFQTARQKIVAVGWFDDPAELQSGKPGMPKRYAPSDRWRTYTPSPEEAAVLRRRRARLESRTKRDRRRRTDFLARAKKGG